MTDPAEFTNRCACGWEVTGTEDLVVEATLEHARRIHNMTATREQILAVLHGAGGAAAPGPEAAAG